MVAAHRALRSVPPMPRSLPMSRSLSRRCNVLGTGGGPQGRRPEACRVPACRDLRHTVRRGRRVGERSGSQVDVRIGITQTPKELEVEMPDDADRDTVVAEIEKLLKTGDGVLWLTDRKGRRVGVPVVKVAYVEVGAPSSERRVGFGAP